MLGGGKTRFIDELCSFNQNQLSDLIDNSSHIIEKEEFKKELNNFVRISITFNGEMGVCHPDATKDLIFRILFR